MKIKQKHLSSFWTMNLFTFSIGNYNFSQSNLNNINWNDPELHFSRTLLLLFRERSFFFGRLINPTISLSPHPLLFYMCIGLDMILVLFKKIQHYIWRRQNAIFFASTTPPMSSTHESPEICGSGKNSLDNLCWRSHHFMSSILNLNLNLMKILYSFLYFYFILQFDCSLPTTSFHFSFSSSSEYINLSSNALRLVAGFFFSTNTIRIFFANTFMHSIVLL